MRTVWTLAAIFMAVTLADAYTTWACLHNPIPGVTEANPITAWLFGLMGLVPSLILDGIVTALAAVWIIFTQRVPPLAKSVFFLVVTILTGCAVYYNYQIMIELGIA
jgi:hypothetical protein